MEVVDDMSGYFKNIKDSVQTLSNGLKITLDHFWDARYSRQPVGIEDPTYFDVDKGIVTLQYPSESIPVPDNGRYRLHNEIEDCIVCDKCAKICPVNCIDIEPIRAVEEIGKTSDGTPKRIHAAKFDIDMAKCCFCGLCTTVCPTECLTMTRVYDFSEFDVEDHNYAFSEMTPLEILEKKEALEKYQEAKQKKDGDTPPETTSGSKPKPTFKPRVPSQDSGEQKGAKKPVFKPKVPKPKGDSEASKPKPVFKPRPMIKKKPKDSDDNN